MTKRMSDAAIEQYIASVRKWAVKPADYGPATEETIRRILRGEIAPPFGTVDYGPGADGTGEGAEPETIPADNGGPGLTAEEKRQDARGNYEFALEMIRHKDDKP